MKLVAVTQDSKSCIECEKDIRSNDCICLSTKREKWKLFITKQEGFPIYTVFVTIMWLHVTWRV